MHDFMKALPALFVAVPLLALVFIFNPGASTESRAQQARFSACPSSGGWTLAIWTGSDNSPVSQIDGDCGAVAIDTVFRFDAQAQIWLYHFAAAPESFNTLAVLDTGQVVFLHGKGPTTTPTPTPTPTPAPTPVPSDQGWLGLINYYRAQSGLPPVSEDASLSQGCILHSRYMVKNDVITHAEDPGNPWYTPEGNECGVSGNVAVSTGPNLSDEGAIDLWMQGPFHAVGIIDPRLAKVAFSSYRESDGGVQTGAALDVLRGLASLPSSAPFPIFWPGEGKTAPMLAYEGSESPDPLAGCPGYSAPTGLPIIVQLGTGVNTPSVSSASLTTGGASLEICTFDESSYLNPDPSQQELGRAVLDGRDAVVIIPRSPLVAGAAYTVGLTANGQSYSWSFTASATPR